MCLCLLQEGNTKKEYEIDDESLYDSSTATRGKSHDTNNTFMSEFHTYQQRVLYTILPQQQQQLVQQLYQPRYAPIQQQQGEEQQRIQQQSQQYSAMQQQYTQPQRFQMRGSEMNGVGSSGSTFNYDQARSPSKPSLSASSSSPQLYMTYQPQFGLCNQLRALHQAIAIARVLGRVLVIPDVIDDDGKGPIYRRDTLFDTESLINVLNNAGDGKVYAISTAAYSKLGLSTPKFVLDLKLQSFKQLVPSNLYFDNMGWSHLPTIQVNSLTG